MPGERKMIYLDNGATTKVDERVLDEMIPYFTEHYGNPSSIYSFSKKPRQAIEKARKIISGKLNANPDEIILTSGGSETDNLALRGAAIYAKNNGKTHIITTVIEHHAILNTCRALEKEGFSVTYLKVDNEGFINLDELEKAIRDDTFLVSIMHANNEIGTIQDISAIGKLCRGKRVYFHTDAVQSFTKVPIDVVEMNIDMLSIASHKIHGPKGVGALYLRKGVRIANLITGGSQENNRRAGTENVPGIAGFGKAVELAKPEHIEKMIKLRDYMIKQIEDSIPDAKLNGPRQKRLCNNINIGFRYIEGEGILMSLDMEGICVSTGSACSSKSLDPSHVLMSLGLKHEEVHGSIRFTISRFTEKEEIDFTVEKLKGIIEHLRKLSPLTPR